MNNKDMSERNMGTMIQQYQGAKREHDECAKWASLIGSPYRGGGGGIGELISLRLMNGDGAPTVYHQCSNGANNYHRMPPALAPHLEAAIKARFGELLADALGRQKAALKKAAEAAAKEYGELLKAAGITEIYTNPLGAFIHTQE